MAEIEFSILSRQCLSRRIPDQETLKREVQAWQNRRNQQHTTVNWRFTTQEARIKLKNYIRQIYSDTALGVSLVMIYAELSDASALERLDIALSAATNLKWYRRLMIIRLSATEGLSVPKLAKMFNLSDDSVRSYIHKYNTSGLEALMPKSPPGHRGKITHFSKSDWERLFEQTPDQYEKLQTDSRHWTLDLISIYFKAYHEISVTPPAIHLALRRTGYRTGRSKLRVGSPDPDYQAKRDQLAELTSLRKRDD